MGDKFHFVSGEASLNLTNGPMKLGKASKKMNPEQKTEFNVQCFSR